MKCVDCGDRDVQIKKWNRCTRCYAVLRKQKIKSDGVFYQGPNRPDTNLCRRIIFEVRFPADKIVSIENAQIDNISIPLSELEQKE